MTWGGEDCGPDGLTPDGAPCVPDTNTPPNNPPTPTGDNHGCPTGTVWTVTDPASGYGFCASPGYEPASEEDDENARNGDYGEFNFPDFSGFDYSVDLGDVPRFKGSRFAAPTLEDAQNEPGYAFARDEGLNALQSSNAAKGLSRTGGAFKGLTSYANQFAEQNYGNVWNRAYQKWGADFDVDKAEYAPLLTGWLTNAQARQRAKELRGQDFFRAWQERLGMDKYILGLGSA